MSIKPEFIAAFNVFKKHFPDLSPESETDVFFALNDAIKVYQKEELKNSIQKEVL
jgi:hypothetical protein